MKTGFLTTTWRSVILGGLLVVSSGCGSTVMMANPNADPCIEQKSSRGWFTSDTSMKYNLVCAQRRAGEALSMHPDPDIKALGVEITTEIIAGDDPDRQKKIDDAKARAAALYLEAAKKEEDLIRREILNDMSAHQPPQGPVSCTVEASSKGKKGEGRVVTFTNCTPQSP